MVQFNLYYQDGAEGNLSGALLLLYLQPFVIKISFQI